MVVVDSEPTATGERLELLAVVRGLEALEGPARVTLVTKSRYVSRGIKVGLPQWRANDWCWENFGRLVPVRDHDLWQRVDRALLFHEVDCQSWHFDETAEAASDQSLLETTEVERVPVIHRRGRLAACQGDLSHGARRISGLPRSDRAGGTTTARGLKSRGYSPPASSRWLDKGKQQLARWGEAARIASQPMRQLVQGGV
jgi:hypothetical protein